MVQCGASRGVSCGAVCGAVCGASRGAVCGVAGRGKALPALPCPALHTASAREEILRAKLKSNRELRDKMTNWG